MADQRRLVIRSIFYFYGEAADKALAIRVADEMAFSWNESKTLIRLKRDIYDIRFEIEGMYEPDLSPATVWHNKDPRLNFFRVEEFSKHDISFVDGIGSNTGYFKLLNLASQSTTAAHEYGHTLGLDHPEQLDIRGKGQPGIMYPRGTICDPDYQYDPAGRPGGPGGTLNPATRKVLDSDIEDLKLYRLKFDRKRRAIVGEFSSLYHHKHMPA